MYDWALALALLNAPSGDYDGRLAKVSQSVWDKTCRLAVEEELLDPRVEAGFADNLPGRPYSLWVLRDRRESFAGVPFVIDQKRWPHIEDVNKGLVFSVIYETEILKKHQELKKAGGGVERFELLYEEAIYLGTCYEVMKLALDEREHIENRRNRMKKLIEMIGEDNYYRGNFPPPVPLWRFQWKKE